MSNTGDDADFEGIMQGLREAVDYVEGKADPTGYRVHAPVNVDVKAIRARTGLTQEQFSNRFGFKVSAVREWEQERRKPEAAARILLRVIEREPEAVDRALAG